MPINIYKEKNGEKIDCLCNDAWDLPNQVDIFEKWLIVEGEKLPKSSYVADIGFDIRKDANGGGSIISATAMRIMGEIGMSIYLSEYPGSNER